MTGILLYSLVSYVSLILHTHVALYQLLFVVEGTVISLRLYGMTLVRDDFYLRLKAYLSMMTVGLVMQGAKCSSVCAWGLGECYFSSAQVAGL